MSRARVSGSSTVTFVGTATVVDTATLIDVGRTGGERAPATASAGDCAGRSFAGWATRPAGAHGTTAAVVLAGVPVVVGAVADAGVIAPVVPEAAAPTEEGPAIPQEAGPSGTPGIVGFGCGFGCSGTTAC
jgi:hypothetical protein